MDPIIKILNDKEIEIILECLVAAGNPELFPDWEFETLFGVSKIKFLEVQKKWPNVDCSDSDVSASIVGALNNLLGYPHWMHEEWNKNFSYPSLTVKLILEKLITCGI